MTDSNFGTSTLRPQTKALTIGELAAKIGVSKGTVSRALNNYPDISERTKLKVVKAAEKYGYRPSSFAQSIKTGSTKSVALILSVSGASVQQAHLAEFLDGISWRLGEDDWTMTVATASSDQSDVGLHRRLIEEKKVDGFIIPRTKGVDPRIALMRESDMPFVLYGRTQDVRDCAWFDIAGEDAMASAVARLADNGHERIAYVGVDPDFHMAFVRESGFDQGIADRGLEADPALKVYGAMTERAGADAARRLMALDRPPTAIVCGMDLAALGVLGFLGDTGLQAGRDVSVIGYDGIPESAYATPPLSTYSVDTRGSGRSLADLLLRRIKGEAPEGLRTLGAATFIQRTSDGPVTLSSDELAARIAAS